MPHAGEVPIANAVPDRRGLCLVIAAPSGCGKTSIMERLLADDRRIERSVSATTRAPRPGEVNGVDYYFKTRAEFDALVDSGGMLEHATVFGRSYGIPKAPVVAALEGGSDVVFVIDWQGHRTLRERLPGDVLGIFLLPPSRAALEARLRLRGDTPEQIRSRMEEAESEASHAGEFDYRVVNDDFETALGEVRAILAAARVKLLQRSGLAA